MKVKKLLLGAIFVIALNGMAEYSFPNGAPVSGKYTVSGFYGSEEISGTLEFTNTNAKIVFDGSGDEITGGTKIIIPAGGTVEIENGFLKKWLITGDATYSSEYTVPSNTISGIIQNDGVTTAAAATAIIPPVQPILPQPSLPQPSLPPAPPTGEFTIPRSRVNLDLVRNTKSTTYRNMENYKENGYDLNIEYIGGLGGLYKDKGDIIKYDWVSNGAVITGTKNFGSVTVGGTFGYQDSKVKYKERFAGTEEDIDSYQLGVSARYNLTDKTDMTAVFTHGTGKHKFTAENQADEIHNAEYTSKIYDFDWRMGTKYGFENGYIKPYFGFGVTLVDEKEIEKINAGKAEDYFEYLVGGAYGELNFGKLGLYGNMEATYRLDESSYHVRRSYKGTAEMAPLRYCRMEYNLGLGAKYRVNDMFNVNANYELDNFRNNIFKVGFGMEF